MYDYIRALHAGACREPELRSTRVELDRAQRKPGNEGCQGGLLP